MIVSELQRIKSEVMLASQLVTDGATVTANLDCRGADYARIIVNLGAEETTNATTVTLSLLESDDTVVTNFATVTANATPGLENAHQRVYHVDMRNRKRYLRLSFTAGTGTGSNAYVGAVADLYLQDEAPASTSDMVASTNDAVTILPA